jgi:hypothetical protein
MSYVAVWAAEESAQDTDAMLVEVLAELREVKRRLDATGADNPSHLGSRGRA